MPRVQTRAGECSSGVGPHRRKTGAARVGRRAGEDAAFWLINREQARLQHEKAVADQTLALLQDPELPFAGNLRAKKPHDHRRSSLRETAGLGRNEENPPLRSETGWIAWRAALLPRLAIDVLLLPE